MFIKFMFHRLSTLIGASGGDLLRSQNFNWFYMQKTVFNHPGKVSFNIASEASYVYILSGQKLIKNA